MNLYFWWKMWDWMKNTILLIQSLLSKLSLSPKPSQSWAELTLITRLHPPHRTHRTAPAKVSSELFWAVLSCFSALTYLISQFLLNWGKYIKDQWPYPNQYQDAKPQSGTSSVLQSPKWGLKGHGCSLHLQNQDREPKFGSWVYQRPLTISKSISRCQTPVRNLQHLPKPHV